jgi:hypothetical protein
MSTRHRRGSRRARTTLGVLLAALLAGSLGIVSSVAAQPPPAVTTLSPDDARQAGRAVSIIDIDVGGQRLVAVSAPVDPARSNDTVTDDPGDAERQRREAMRLLDVAADGTLAIADAIGDPHAGLAIAAPSGGQILVSMPGVAAAAFAPQGGWLAVVDGLGRLWRVDATSGSATPLADGPFGGAIGFGADGALLLVALPSVEAPYAGSLVRVDPESARVRAVAGGDRLGLVLAAGGLADGSLAVVVHRPEDGTSLLRLADGAVSRIASLSPDAVDVSVSDDGTRAAYALADGEAFLQQPGDTAPIALGAGALPRIAGDGRAVAILRDGQTVLVNDEGRELQRIASPLARWAGPAGRCEGCGS